MSSRDQYFGIALAGRKCAGKDTVMNAIMAVYPGVFRMIRCKQPIVDGFVAWRGGAPYVKPDDDEMLIQYSSEIARHENPKIVSEYLQQQIAQCLDDRRYADGAKKHIAYLPIIPDLRFPDENATLLRLNVLRLKIHADLEILKNRTFERDGNLRAWQPENETERHVDEMHYDEIIDNNANDLGRTAIAHALNVVRHLIIPK